MMIDAPHIGPAADVSRRRRDDVAAAGADIDALPERRILHLLGAEARDLDAIRAGKQEMLAAAAGERAPRERECTVFALEREQALVTTVPRIDIDHQESIGRDA